MKLFVIRLLYSPYCAERWSYRIPIRILGPFINRVCKRLYFWNPFGYIQKNNPTLEHYIRNVYKTMEVVFYDINIGVGIARAEGTLAFMFVPTYFLSEKNEEYIDYFQKFESHKNNAVWHAISSIFFIGAVCAGIIFIMWWNEN